MEWQWIDVDTLTPTDINADIIEERLYGGLLGWAYTTTSCTKPFLRPPARNEEIIFS